jgi:hypothetical protein
MWTGDVTVDPFVGVQILIEGIVEDGEHEPPPELPTVTVAVAEVEPPGPVAVSVYVVVAVGETVWLPEVATDPIPLSIETDVALVVLQVSVELPPEEIDDGLALKLIVGVGLPPLPTVILMDVFGMRPAWSHACTTMKCLPADILMLALISETFCFVARTLST